MTKTIQNQSTNPNDVTKLPFEVVNAGIFESAEVIDIILNDSHPEYTGFKDIGRIFVRRLKRDARTHSTSAVNVTAYPFFPNMKHYPLRFEIVMLIQGPSEYNGVDNSTSYYYIPSYAVWGLTNHNALPFVAGLHATETKNESSGYLSDVSSLASPDAIDFGPNFKENTGVPILQPYDGDVILTGRFGNSIRFGSTSLESKPKNNWSSEGETGSPILIISNTEPKSDKTGNITIEDINIDDSSIYLCSNQKIEIETSSDNYSGYKNQPIKPDEYLGNQVMINSDRIVFNSKKDDLMMIAQKSVGISSAGTVNISADKQFIVNADSYYLGTNSTEHMMLGDTAKKWLNDLITAISSITVPTGTGPSGVPVNIAQFKVLASRLDSLLSKKSFLE